MRSFIFQFYLNFLFMNKVGECYLPSIVRRQYFSIIFNEKSADYSRTIQWQTHHLTPTMIQAICPKCLTLKKTLAYCAAIKHDNSKKVLEYWPLKERLICKWDQLPGPVSQNFFKDECKSHWKSTLWKMQTIVWIPKFPFT